MNAILLFDGAFSTYYTELGGTFPECEMANLFDRDRVLEIHKAYIQVGAQVIKTNTFAAYPDLLSCSRETANAVIRAGVDLARQAVGDGEVRIFADLGPLSSEPVEDPEIRKSTDLEEADRLAEIYFNQAMVFADLGIKDFLFETFSSPEALVLAARKIRDKVPEAFILASFATRPDGYTQSGYSLQNLVDRLDQEEAISAMGANCVTGPVQLAQIVTGLRMPSKPFSVMPNASMPQVINRRSDYAHNATYFAQALAGLKGRVQIFGGCCGTRPDHIRRLKEALDRTEGGLVLERRSAPVPIRKESADNSLAQKLARGQEVITVEYDPPQSADIQNYMEGARAIAEAGVDAITIADCPIGRARVDSSILGIKLKRELGIEPVVHLTCRDRNLNALKALLLGLNLEGVLNVLVVTGDPIPSADKETIKGVYNFNSERLSRFIIDLNQNEFANPMLVSGALNINAPRFDYELRRAQKKAEAGVQVFYTQPMSSERALENLRLARESLEAKLICGIMPVVSHRNALFMNTEVAGMHLEEDLIQAYEGADREAGERLGIDFSLKFMDQAAPYADGFYLITPFNRTGLITEIVRLWKMKSEENHA